MPLIALGGDHEIHTVRVVVLLSAVSNSINLVSTNAYMSNWFPRKKGIALGWSTMGAPISSATCIAIFTGIFCNLII